MSGMPAARISDSVVNGVITTGSATVLIGTQGGVACSTCPGGMAVGHPVNPSLGAKVLGGAEDLDFSLPGAMGVVWQRHYSSYVNPEHGGACGMLGYGWTLPFEMSLQLNDDSTLLFDANGRTITFAESLEPGGSLFSSSEELYLARGSHQSCSWQNDARFAGVPADWRQGDESLIATSGDGQMLWRFLPVRSPYWSTPRWLMHAKRDRFGREQQFAYSTVRHDQPETNDGRQPLEFPWPLLTRITDGCGRNFILEYAALHERAWNAAEVHKQHDKGRFFPHHPEMDGHRGQAGWQPDSGWRLQGVQVQETDGARKTLVRYSFSDQGDLIEVRDRHERVIRRFAYKNHLLFAHQWLQGPEHLYAYEADLPGARVLEQRNEQGLNYRFFYQPHPDAPQDPVRSRTRVQDSLNREDVYEFHGEGGLKRLVRHKRPDGSCLEYQYNASGQLTGQTDPLGRTTWLARDGEGRLLAVRSPTAEPVELRYDSSGQLIERRVGQQSTRYLYDDCQRLSQITLPGGATQSYKYADIAEGASLLTAEYPIQIEDAQGGVKQLQWSRVGQLLSHTDCSQRTTRYEYDRSGQLCAVQLADDTSIVYQYNSLEQLEATRYADGSGERYQYDEAGRPVCITPLDARQQPIADQEIILGYDLWSRVVRRSHAGNQLKFAFDVRGLLVELTNENAAISRFEWDARDRLIKETGFDGRTQHYHYSALGLLVAQDDGQNGQLQRIHYDYDAKDNLILRRWGSAGNQPSQREQSMLPGYLSAEDSSPYEQRFVWGAQRRLLQAQLYQGHGPDAHLQTECLYEYNASGQLWEETQRVWNADESGEPQLQHEYRLEHQYDALGNRTQSRLPDIGELGILRYGAGHVQGIALNQKGLMYIQRDTLHREIKRQWFTGTEDNESLITRQQHWDPVNRLQQRIYQGLPSHLSGPEPDDIHQHQGQETDLLLNLQQRHYHYDALGQLIRIQQPAQTQYYAYDDQGRLHAARLGEDSTARQGWCFDAAGNLLPPLDAQQPAPQDWAETVRQRWQEPGFNLIQPEALPDTAQARYWPDNRVLFSEHERYQYDSRGNRTQSHHTETGHKKQYYYNALNQLVRIDHYKEDSKLECSSYQYDPLGRRLVKQVHLYRIEQGGQGAANGHDSDKLIFEETNALEYYGWDGDRLAFTKDQSSQWHYLYEPDNFTPMLLIRKDSEPEGSEGQQALADSMALLLGNKQQRPGDPAEEPRQQMREQIIATLKEKDLWQDPDLPQDCYFYHCNHLGLPEALTDRGGQIVWAAEYDPWGNLQQEHNPKRLKQHLRLPGQYHDPETGLYYNRHRYYDPALGSYISQDPIGLDSGEPNFYAYPKNPVVEVDPLGLSPVAGAVRTVAAADTARGKTWCVMQSYAIRQDRVQLPGLLEKELKMIDEVKSAREESCETDKRNRRVLTRDSEEVIQGGYNTCMVDADIKHGEEVGGAKQINADHYANLDKRAEDLYVECFGSPSISLPESKGGRK